MTDPDFYSWFAYGSSLLITMLFANQYEKSGKRQYLFLSFLTTLLFCGCRFYVGNDYHGYYYTFELIKYSAINVFFIEPAYGLLNLLFSFSPIGYFYCLFICSAITYSITFYLLAKHHVLKWGVFAIYTLGFLIIANDQVRQMTAVPIFFLAIKYIEENKIIKYLLCIAIATTFHYSASFYIIAYLLRYVNVRKKWALAFLCFAFLVQISGGVNGFMHGMSQYLHFFNEAYALKSEDDKYYPEGTFGLQLLYFWLVSMFILMKIPKSKYTDITVKMFACGSVLYVLFWGQMLFERMTLYFFETIIFVFPIAVKQSKYLGKIVISACFLYFSLQSLFAMEKNGAVPYRTFINEKMENPIYDNDTQTK